MGNYKKDIPDGEGIKVLQESDAVVMRIKQEGREEGLQEGREEGLAQGKEEGRKKGKEEGLQEGVQLVLQQLRNNGYTDEEINAMLNKKRGDSIKPMKLD